MCNKPYDSVRAKRGNTTEGSANSHRKPTVPFRALLGVVPPRVVGVVPCRPLLTILTLALFVGGCNANYIRVAGPANLTLSATMWTPGFNVTLGDENSEVLIKRGGMSLFNGEKEPTFAEGTEAGGGVPPVVPQPDPE